MEKREKYTLEELLEGINEENRHKEFDWGEDVGKEQIWSMTDEEY